MDGIKQFFSPFFATMKFIQNNFKAMLFLLLLFLIFSPSEAELEPANLAAIKLEGVIMDASLVVEQLEAAREDNTIKGVLFVINSPGGSVHLLSRLWRRLNVLRQKSQLLLTQQELLRVGHIMLQFMPMRFMQILVQWLVQLV